MIADSLVKEFKDAALLLSAGGDGGPDSLTPLLSSLTASSLRDMAIQHDKADGLLGQIIVRPKAWCRDKSKTGFPVLAEASCHVLGRFVFRGVQARNRQIIAGLFQGLSEYRCIQRLSLVDGMKHIPQSL